MSREGSYVDMGSAGTAVMNEKEKAVARKKAQKLEYVSYLALSLNTISDPGLLCRCSEMRLRRACSSPEQVLPMAGRVSETLLLQAKRLPVYDNSLQAPMTPTNKV
jgi:hypothetical protein